MDRLERVANARTDLFFVAERRLRLGRRYNAGLISTVAPRRRINLYTDLITALIHYLLKRLLDATKSFVSTHPPVPGSVGRRCAGPDATAIDFGALCAFAGRHPARRVWSLAGQQRPALLRPGHSR